MVWVILIVADAAKHVGVATRPSDEEVGLRRNDVVDDLRTEVLQLLDAIDRTGTEFFLPVDTMRYVQ